ncbi:MAG: 30S ribosomal protein S3ae [Candidatus Hodarchaeales archaeon]
MSSKQRRSKSTRGKQIDKWSLKQLFTIVSPDDLEIGQTAKGTPIGETIGVDEKNITGRVLEVPLSDLTQKYSLIYVKLLFKITDVIGTTAKTKFSGHSYAHDYVRSLVKRRRTRVDSIMNVTTSDNIALRLTSTAFTTRRAKSSHKQEIRRIMMEIIDKFAGELTFSEFVIKMINGDMNAELLDNCQKIYPLTQVDVQKSKVVTKLV